MTIRHDLAWARRFAVLSALIAVTWVAPAEAHLVTTGLGPVYDGISHVLLSPEDLMCVLAMAVFAGLNGATAGRRTLFAFTAAWFVGGVAGYLVGHPLLPAALTAGSLIVLGGLTAADLRLPVAFVTSLSVTIGLIHGSLNGAGIASAQREPLALTGIASVIFVLVALGAALVVSRRTAWQRVALRVAGSWVAAIGVLMLGWSIRA